MLALAFGLVVPDPGKPQQPSAGAGIGMAQPPAPLPAQQEKELAPVHTVALAVNHAGPQNAGGRPAVLWTAAHTAP